MSKSDVQRDLRAQVHHLTECNRVYQRALAEIFAAAYGLSESDADKFEPPPIELAFWRTGTMSRDELLLCVQDWWQKLVAHSIAANEDGFTVRCHRCESERVAVAHVSATGTVREWR